MGLDKKALEDELKAVYDSVSDVELSPSEGRKRLAKGVSEAVHKYITGADVVVDVGIEVKTTGSAAAQTGKTTSQGSGKIK